MIYSRGSPNKPQDVVKLLTSFSDFPPPFLSCTSRAEPAPAFLLILAVLVAASGQYPKVNQEKGYTLLHSLLSLFDAILGKFCRTGRLNQISSVSAEVKTKEHHLDLVRVGLKLEKGLLGAVRRDAAENAHASCMKIDVINVFFQEIGTFSMTAEQLKMMQRMRRTKGGSSKSRDVFVMVPELE